MRHLAVLALAVACGTPAPPVAPLVTAIATPTRPLPAAPIVRTDAAAGGIEAPHAGPIVLVAATPDGTAALSSDVGGGVRLWPALDGSQEPRVVALPEPHALAIGPRDGGYTAAVLDAAGGLYIANIDAQGASRAHVTLPAEPAFRGIAMSSRGLVAWRADQTVVLLDGDGVTRAQLATDPGERIVTVAVAGGHTTALLDHAPTASAACAGSCSMRTRRGVDLVEIGGQVGNLLAVSPSGTELALREAEDTIVGARRSRAASRALAARAGRCARIRRRRAPRRDPNGGQLLWITVGKQSRRTARHHHAAARDRRRPRDHGQQQRPRRRVRRRHQVPRLRRRVGRRSRSPPPMASC